MTQKRPTTFREWRALWWESCREIGSQICWATHGGRWRLVMDRDLWKEIRRCERLYNRIQVEIEVRDESFMQTLAEGLLAEIRNRQEGGDAQ